MAPFVVRRIVPVACDRVWGVLSDFRGHGRWAPATRVRADPGEPRPGWSFTAITGYGLGVVRDVMTVDLWEPPAREAPTRPARFRISKRGPFFGGWANVQVTPLGGVLGPSTCEVVWTQDLRVRVPVLGRLLAPLIRPLSKAAYEVVIDRMLVAAAKPA